MAAQDKSSLHVLNAGLVADRSVLIGLTSPEMASVFATLRMSVNTKKTLTVIDNGNTFFTSANMLELIKANDDKYRLIAEKAGVTLREEDIQAIQGAEAAKKAIEAAMIPPIPPYPFGPKPANWSVATDLTITTGNRATVRRLRTNPNANGTGYSISVLQLKRIWAIASVRWKTKTSVRHIGSISADGYSRSGTVYDAHVEVGCQTIRRYELEQLALHLNWDFPADK